MQNQTVGEWDEPEDDDDAEPSIFDMTDRDYLLDLRERLRAVPVMYGVDGSDIDRLGELIGRLEAGG